MQCWDALYKRIRGAKAMDSTIVINSEHLGSGPEELGQKLMGSFLRKMCILENKPERIIFYNTGVKLLSEGSQVLDALDMLSKEGIDLIACGTCINYFELNEKLVVGRISDMLEIVKTLTRSGSVITV
jgi:selenium metabolism protein YedF